MCQLHGIDGIRQHRSGELDLGEVGLWEGARDARQGGNKSQIRGVFFITQAAHISSVPLWSSHVHSLGVKEQDENPLLSIP